MVSEAQHNLCVHLAYKACTPLRLGTGRNGAASAHVYRQAKVAKTLRLPVAALPLFACLVGNDYMPDAGAIHRAMFTHLARTRMKRHQASQANVKAAASQSFAAAAAAAAGSRRHASPKQQAYPKYT